MVTIVLKEDFGKILDMEEVEAQSYDQEEAHQKAIDLASEKLNDCYRIVTAAEKAFFKKFNITMTEEKDELTQKIEKANKAMEYYNGIYRIFSRVNRQYSYAHNALAAKDIAGLEQHGTTLVAFAGEGLQQLNGKKAYDGDDALRSAAVEYLTFCREEGKVTYPANVDFYLKNDEMQRAYKKLNATREKDRTQKDVDAYNLAVERYNRAVKEINKINNASVKKNGELIKGWNKQMEGFFDKHS
jgi:hypothetical protein